MKGGGGGQILLQGCDKTVDGGGQVGTKQTPDGLGEDIGLAPGQEVALNVVVGVPGDGGLGGDGEEGERSHAFGVEPGVD